MMYGKKINTKRERMHPILIWIIASILLHLLIMLGFVSIKMRHAPEKNRLLQDRADRALLMMDEPKKQIAQTPIQSPPVKPIEKKVEEAKPKHKLTDFTLVPGRAGLDKQQLDDPANLNNLPTPDNQHLQKKAETKEVKKEKTKQFEEPEDIDEPEEVTELETPVQNNIQKLETLPEQKQEPSPISMMHEAPQAKSPAATPSKIAGHKKIRIKPSEQDPHEYSPNPSREVSFKNLNLGFDINAKTVGNNAHMIQQGITFAAPDEVSLKHLTYYHQCAGMMKTAFATHPQVRLRQYATGKKFRFDITVDRKGNQINFQTIHGSGDMILDKIIQESIQSVKMFPNVPNFIEDNPFVMHWTFLH